MSNTKENIKQDLRDGFSTKESAMLSLMKILDQIKRFQERIRRHIEDNYVDFMPNNTTSDIYIEDGETLLRETEYLLQHVGGDARLALTEANTELANSIVELHEASLGLRISYRVLKIDDLFQCIENAKASKDYLMALDILGKLKYLIYSESTTEINRLFQKCNCYDTIKIKYHIQMNILKQNLQHRFDCLVKFSEKTFPSAKNVCLQVSKDVSQLQDTVLALFQARYNPMKICNFLLENCLIPMITKPVSLEYSTDNEDYFQLNISYSLKELGRSLRPSYKLVFMHVKSLLDCLSNINVNVSAEQHVFTIIGSYIKDRFLQTIVHDCLVHEIPETVDDYQHSTLVVEVLHFEQMLADAFLIDPDKDRALSEFAQKFDVYFKERLTQQVFESARDIMQKDLQDMVVIADGNKAEEMAKNPLLFPQCMISKSTLELVKLMKRVLHQSMNTSSSTEGDERNNIEGDKTNSSPSVIAIILKTYLNDVPKIHEKLLETIPQQAALFYNNCMFLSHWVAKNAETGIPTHPALVKTLQAAGTNIFKAQVVHQEKILMQILKEFGKIRTIFYV